jgi:hypothetical protein
MTRSAAGRAMPVIRCLAVVLPLAVSLGGCVTDPRVQAFSSVTTSPAPATDGDLGTLTYRAVDLMMAGAPQVTDATKLVVASVANAEKLDASTPLGNIVADMIRGRLAQTGHTTAEMRLRSSVRLQKDGGEFLLSRDRRALMPAPDAAAIVTGTYAVGFEKVYVSLKLVSAGDARILSAADFVVPRRETDGLLGERPR